MRKLLRLGSSDDPALTAVTRLQRLRHAIEEHQAQEDAINAMFGSERFPVAQVIPDRLPRPTYGEIMGLIEEREARRSARGRG